jgi:hypothetical protein
MRIQLYNYNWRENLIFTTQILLPQKLKTTEGDNHLIAAKFKMMPLSEDVILSKDRPYCYC